MSSDIKELTLKVIQFIGPQAELFTSSQYSAELLAIQSGRAHRKKRVYLKCYAAVANILEKKLPLDRKQLSQSKYRQ